MGREDLYSGKSYVYQRGEALREANAKLVRSALDGMNDSQFLAYLAMSIDSEGNDFGSRYFAERLDKIALMMTAYETLECGDNA